MDNEIAMMNQWAHEQSWMSYGLEMTTAMYHQLKITSKIVYTKIKQLNKGPLADDWRKIYDEISKHKLHEVGFQLTSQSKEDKGTTRVLWHRKKRNKESQGKTSQARVLSLKQGLDRPPIMSTPN